MKIINKALTAILFLFCIPYNLNAQAKNSSYESFVKGFNIVRKSFQTLDGRENIGKIKNITLNYQELNSSRGQNVSPNDANFMQKGGNSKLVFDVQNNQSYHKRHLQRRGRLFNPIIVLKDKGSFFYWNETKELNTSLNTDVIKGSFNFRFAYPQRLFPHILLQNALQNKQRYINAFNNSSFEGMLNYYKANYPAAPKKNASTKTASQSPRNIPKPKKINIPILMIYGLKDQALPPGMLNNTWNHIDNDVTILTIPKAGHFVQQEAHQKVTKMIKMWLSQ